MIAIDRNAKFINFNYTLTLQHLYGISDNNTLHIHGSSLQPNTIILGHGWKQKKPKSNREDYYDVDARIEQRGLVVEKYFESTFKSTESVMKNSHIFFESLKDIDSIIVLGHSLGDVDLPYFLKLIEIVNKRCSWTFSFHKEMLVIQKQVEKLR